MSEAAPRISAAEWHVMEAVWDRHPISAAELAELLEPEHGWSEATVKTMLGRLSKKGALRFSRDGKRYLYEPAVAREDCVRSEAQSLVDRLFGGDASPMLTWFVEESPLSESEIDELQQLLDSKRGRARRKRRRKS